MTSAAESLRRHLSGKAIPVRGLVAAIVVFAAALGPGTASAHRLFNTNRVLEHTDNECLNLRHNECSSIPSPRVSLKAGASTRIELACGRERPFLLGWDARHHEHIGLTLVSDPPDRSASAKAAIQPESVTVFATNQADARGFVRLFIGCTAEPVVWAPFALSRNGLPSKALRRIGN
jgi:hypothetical protein